MHNIPENQRLSNSGGIFAEYKNARVDQRSPRANYQTSLSPQALALFRPQRSKRRSRQEQATTQHYLLIIGKALSTFNAPDIGFDYFGGIFAVLGFNLSELEPVELYDETLARAVLGFTHKPTSEEKNRAVAREADRRRKQRERLNKWQARAENPLLFEHNNDFNKQTRKRNSIYTFYFPELVRDIVKAAPVGSSMAAIDCAVREHCSTYLERFTGEAKRVRPKQRQSIASIVKRGGTELSRAISQARKEAREKAEREQHEQTADTDAENELLNLFETEFAAKLSPVENALFYKWAFDKWQTLQGFTDSPTGQLSGRPAHTLAYTLLRNRIAQNDSQTPSEISTDSGPGVPDAGARVAVELGQSVEEFIADNYDIRQSADARTDQPTARQLRFLRLYRVDGSSLAFADASARIAELKASGAEPFATDAQTALLARAGVADPSLTIRQASDRIEQLRAAGELMPSDWFSLAELEKFDPKARGFSKKERRFCCPQCGTGKPLDSEHRSLAANTQTGLYHCHRCAAAGILREFCGETVGAPRQFPALPKPEPTPEEIEAANRWRARVERAQRITATRPDSTGAAYLASRGISAETAQSAGVKFGDWWKRNDEADKPERFAAVIFPIHDQHGKLVAAQARAIKGDAKRTAGEKETGIFQATPNALAATCVAVVEAPIDALALAASGFDAIALCGTSWPEWLPNALADKTVLIATDADKPGDECAARFTEALQGLATVRRLRPQGGKDWAEVLGQHGQASIEAQTECALGCAEPGAFDDFDEEERA